MLFLLSPSLHAITLCSRPPRRCGCAVSCIGDAAISGSRHLGCDSSAEQQTASASACGSSIAAAVPFRWCPAKTPPVDSPRLAPQTANRDMGHEGGTSSALHCAQDGAQGPFKPAPTDHRVAQSDTSAVNGPPGGQCASGILNCAAFATLQRFEPPRINTDESSSCAVRASQIRNQHRCEPASC